MVGHAGQQPGIGERESDFLESLQVTREIEMDLKDWNFSRPINNRDYTPK